MTSVLWMIKLLQTVIQTNIFQQFSGIRFCVSLMLMCACYAGMFFVFVIARWLFFILTMSLCDSLHKPSLSRVYAFIASSGRYPLVHAMMLLLIERMFVFPLCGIVSVLTYYHAL